MHHPKIKGWTHKELEFEAEKLLSDFSKLGCYDNRALRIEALIDRYGLRVIQVKGLSEIAEAVLPIKEGYILIDEDRYNDVSSELMVRFTLAEELCHNVLHRPLFSGKTLDQIRRFQESLSDTQYERIEREAKHMAGALLMSGPVYRHRFAHFMATQNGSPHSQVTKLRYVIRQLTFDFAVSFQAATLRGVILGLLDWEQYNDLMELISRS